MNLVQNGGKFGQDHGLFTVGPGGDHADAGSALALLEAQVILGCLGQLLVVGNALGGGLPSFERGVDGLDVLQAVDVGRDLVGHLAAELIANADGNFGQRVEHVELGDDQPFGAIDLVGV